MEFTPADGFSGSTSFTYTVIDVVGQTADATVTVTVVAGLIAVDDVVKTGFGKPVTVPVLRNDVGVGLSVASLGAVVDGKATLNGDVAFNEQITDTATAKYTSLPGNVTTPQSPYNSVSTERTGNTSYPGGNANDFLTSGSGTFIATLTATDQAGSTSTGVTTTIIVPGASGGAPTATIGGAPVSSLAETPITLTASATDPTPGEAAAGFSYAWSITKGGAVFATGTGSTFTFTPDGPGYFSVSLIAAASPGCSFVPFTFSSPLMSWSQP